MLAKKIANARIFEDKDGNLAGSYIIDSDGTVTEYDEDGEEL